MCTCNLHNSEPWEAREDRGKKEGGDGVMEKEQKNERCSTGDAEAEEADREREKRGVRKHVGCGQSIIQERKVHLTLGAALNMPGLASPSNGLQIDMLPEQTLPIPQQLSLSLPIRALIGALRWNV